MDLDTQCTGTDAGTAETWFDTESFCAVMMTGISGWPGEAEDWKAHSQGSRTEAVRFAQLHISLG